MSDASFAALDAVVLQQVDAVTSLADENARLRALLADRETTPIATTPVALDPAALLAELQATKAAQDGLFRELKAMRDAQAAAPRFEDHSDEVSLLRDSLVDLANQLEQEKARVSTLESQRRAEQEKVTTLRSTVEESRRAVMRLQNESASKRAPSVTFDQGYSFPPRRPSAINNAPRRRSSLGLAAITGSPTSPETAEAIPMPIGFGLGFAVESPTTSNFPPMSISPATAKASPFARLAHRRGSASLAAFSATASSEEDDRAARLRELRLGVTSMKVHSRRNSAITGLPEFAQPFDWDLERRFARRLSVASSARRSNRGSFSGNDSEDSLSMSGPPSANLRMLGRKASVAMFEPWSRRSSATSSMGGWPTSEYNVEDAESNHLSDLHLQLQGLRIQLAEAEEGRRASELCLNALKEFIHRSNTDGEPSGLSLPPLPSDSSSNSLGDERRPAAPSRWSIPRLSLSGRRESNSTPTARSDSPAFSNARRSSAASTTDSHFDRTTPSLPSFGSFSFSLGARPQSTVIVDADTSPTMHSGEMFPSDPSPFLPSSSRAPSHRSRRSEDLDPLSSPDDGDCDGRSTAPSLVSDMSSRGSSRSSSPEIEQSGLGCFGLSSPQVVVDFVDDGRDQLVEAARVPAAMAKSSLTTLAQSRAAAHV